MQTYRPFLEAFQQADLGNVSDLLSESTLLDPEEQGRFLCRVLQALRTLTHAAPLLLTIDDLQWANSATLRLFGFLATRLDNLPVMLVGTVQRAQALPAVTRMNIPLEKHAFCNDAASDAPMTLHPYTVVHEQMEGGGKPGCRWSIALQQLRSGHSLKGWKEVPFQMERAVGASKLHLTMAVQEQLQHPDELAAGEHTWPGEQLGDHGA